MLICRLVTTSWRKLQKRYLSKGPSIIKKEYEEHEITKIRNIGILAHIDAGKTTTTERMLYYSGLIKSMGEVHDGNTVTDYMEQERERGITITSAAVTFDWKNYRINLIDTPGHIDFSMEVEQTLRVLDGAVVILDGSAGVEAQTLTVCRQANNYDIPRIIYVNKMDRADADFDMCLKSIESKLETQVLPIQFPIKNKGILEGIVDVVSLEKLIFNKEHMGMDFTRSKLSENEDKGLWEMAKEKRRGLTDKLSSIDDKLADTVIEQESLDAISSQMLADSLHRSTIERKGVPVLLGSSYKNIGVQPLMDSVLLYLPSPNKNKYSKYYSCFNKQLFARAFKVVHDKQKGPITFLRIYSGSIEKDTKLYNVCKEKGERVGKLYIACADEYQDVHKVTSGNIAAVAGLKITMAGDLVAANSRTMREAEEKLKTLADVKEEDIEKLFSTNSKTLEPVFFCTIEAPSISMQHALETALKQLEREDPSLKVTYNNEFDQIVLGGMGELHLEIIKERIRTEYKIDADLGPLQIAYRETTRAPVKDTYSNSYKLGDKKFDVTVTMSVIPNYEGKQILLLDKTQDCSQNINAIPMHIMKAVKAGVDTVLQNGPKLSFPIVNTGVKLHWLEYTHGITPTIITGAVFQCLKKLLLNAEASLLEPIMRLEIVVPEKYFSAVLNDLSKRRGEVQFIDVRGQNKVIHCFAPLAELFGYSTAIRILSSGYATFSLEYDHYEEMDSINEAQAIKKVTGFY